MSEVVEMMINRDIPAGFIKDKGSYASDLRAAYTPEEMAAFKQAHKIPEKIRDRIARERETGK